MGKIRREHRKLHLSRKTAKTDAQNVDQSSSHVRLDVSRKPSKIQDVKIDDEMFKNVTISLSDLISQELPDFNSQTTSIVDKESTLPDDHATRKLTKKQKRQQKRNDWLKKIDVIQNAKTDEKRRKKQKKKAVVGDLQPMIDALPALDNLLNAASTATNKMAEDEPTTEKHTLKRRQREAILEQQRKHFQLVSTHPAFKADAALALRQHIEKQLEKDPAFTNCRIKAKPRPQKSASSSSSQQHSPQRKPAAITKKNLQTQTRKLRNKK